MTPHYLIQDIDYSHTVIIENGTSPREPMGLQSITSKCQFIKVNKMNISDYLYFMEYFSLALWQNIFILYCKL